MFEKEMSHRANRIEKYFRIFVCLPVCVYVNHANINE